MTILKVPDANFASFYYPEIYRDLLIYFRTNAEKIGLTDENEYEVHIQLLRAFALVGHLNNTRLDMVANELLMDNLTLLESLKRLVKMIGVKLASASPAVVTMLLKLSGVTTSDATAFIPELAEFSTESTPPIFYEVLQDGGIDLDRTDEVSYVYAAEQSKSGVAGFTSTSSPDVFGRAGSDDTFALSDEDNHIFVDAGTGNNGGEFRITEYIDADHVRVIRIPGSEAPGFQTETDLTWSMKVFTTNKATEANSNGSTFTPWATPHVGDLLYVGHVQVLAAQLDLVLDTASSGISKGVFEYFDNTDSKFYPAANPIDNGNGTITFNVDNLLGGVDRSGANIIVEYLPTGAKERVVSSYSSYNLITTLGLLGQVSASTDPEDYALTCDWVPFENQQDDTLNLTVDASVIYNFPQNQERNWQACDVNLQEGIWLRFRIIAVSTPVSPIIDRLRIDQGDQYILATATQGESVGPQILGSGTGGISQEFTLPETPFIDDTDVIEIDEQGSGTWLVWTRVATFLSSTETSRHYVVEVNAEDQATIIFGDGENGKVVPTGTSNVRASYRVGADLDGNVGASEINTNASGVNGISEVSNPKLATGWRMKDGGTTADIERLKREAPAALRTRETASNTEDIARLAVNNFTDENGVKPVIRATVFEEAYGAKTAKLLVVGTGGTILTASQISQLEDYFNGDRYARPPVYGKLLLNYQVTVVNYEPRLVPVQVTVSWLGGNAESVRNALLALLTPLALEDDAATYVWDYNGYISLSRVYSTLHGVDPQMADVPLLKLDGVSSSLKLGANELPYTTAANITVITQD